MEDEILFDEGEILSMERNEMEMSQASEFDSLLNNQAVFDELETEFEEPKGKFKKLCFQEPKP